jgi:hypothetical protein
MCGRPSVYLGRDVVTDMRGRPEKTREDSGIRGIRADRHEDCQEQCREEPTTQHNPTLVQTTGSRGSLRSMVGAWPRRGPTRARAETRRNCQTAARAASDRIVSYPGKTTRASKTIR